MKSTKAAKLRLKPSDYELVEVAIYSVAQHGDYRDLWKYAKGLRQMGASIPRERIQSILDDHSDLIHARAATKFPEEGDPLFRGKIILKAKF